jgi:hypothetical protein
MEIISEVSILSLNPVNQKIFTEEYEKKTAGSKIKNPLELAKRTTTT